MRRLGTGDGDRDGESWMGMCVCAGREGRMGKGGGGVLGGLLCPK